LDSIADENTVCSKNNCGNDATAEGIIKGRDEVDDDGTDILLSLPILSRSYENVLVTPF